MRKRAKKIIRMFDDAVAAEQRYEFQNAKKHYKKIAAHYPGSPEATIATGRIVEMDALSNELRIYKRIDRNARKILTDIGMDVANSPAIMEILMEADAIDMDCEKALFVPIREDYLDECIDRVSTDMPEDPGENAFGTGATPPFLLRPGRDDLSPATPEEFTEIVETAAQFTDSLGILSVPVATDKTMSDYEAAMLMERYFGDLKMTCTRRMSDDECNFFSDRDDWLDGTSLIAGMTVMPNMVEPFIRSAKAGNNLLLLDLTIAGSTGPASPEALLTQIHAQVLFMMVLAQTINPGIGCVHGGIPDVLGLEGALDYSDPGQPLINSAMARLNLWVTGMPSAQSGGSTSIISDIPAAVTEPELSRNKLRTYGVHLLRHAMGALGNLNYFSLEKFILDCQRERDARRAWLMTRHDFLIPLYFPEDKNVVNGIREIAEKGGPRNADHTLNNVDAFYRWHERLAEAAREKEYFPDPDEAVEAKNGELERGSEEESYTQLQDTFLKT